MEWKPLNDRKWELKSEGKVLATIYQKREGRYSLFVASPMIYREIVPQVGRTWIYDTLELAKEGFEEHLHEKILPWCKAVVSYVTSKTSFTKDGGCSDS